MVRQTLFFLVDVEFFDVVNQFLFQAILVVIDPRNRVQALDDALADFLDAKLLVRFDLSQQLLDIVDFLGEFPLQSRAFLPTESDECVECLPDSRRHHFPLVVAKHFSLGSRCHVGHPHQRLKPVLRLWNTEFLGHLLHLPKVIFRQRSVDLCRVAADFLRPNRKLHFSAFQRLRHLLPKFHFLLAIERHDARCEVELLRVERLHLDVDFFLVKGRDSLAVTRH